MSLFTRLSATLIAGVDKTVGRMEDHDAIINASVKDSRRALARAQIRLQHLQRDGAEIRKNIDDNEAQVRDWTRRATSSNDSDRERALACMQRRKTCNENLQRYRESLQRHEQMELQVKQSITELEKRLQQITEQRNQLRTRESVTQAHQIINRLDRDEIGTIHDSLERWDMKIRESEYIEGPIISETTADALEAQFNSEEEALELQAELERLLANKSTDKE